MLEKADNTKKTDILGLINTMRLYVKQEDGTEVVLGSGVGERWLLSQGANERLLKAFEVRPES